MPAPFDWSEEVIERICTELAGGRAMRMICTEAWAPCEALIYRKMASDPELCARVDQARAAQQEFEMDSCIHMADAANEDDWQVVKLRIWARQWRAGKLAPKKYGDRQQIEHSGSIASKTKPVTNEEAMAEIAALSESLGLKYQMVEVVEEEGE